MFSLKVSLYLENSEYVSDDRHPDGGVDLVQRAAFQHLFPEGYCPEECAKVLYALADCHNWQVAVDVKPDLRPLAERSPGSKGGACYRTAYEV